MGDFRIIINGIGGHGVDREKKSGEIVDFNTDPRSPDSFAKNFVEEMKGNGINVTDAQIIHWPLDNYEGQLKNKRSTQITDNLLTGERVGNF